MKKLLVLSLVLFVTFGHAQKRGLFNTLNNGDHRGFSFDFGINIVDSSGNKFSFNPIFEYNENAFTAPFFLGADYRFSKLLSINTKVSTNKWKADVGIIDNNVIGEDLSYLALDVGLKFYFDELFLLFNPDPNTNAFELYLEGGLGYFEFDQGQYSGNFGIGSAVWFTDNISLNLQVMGKLSLAQKSFYGTNHIQTFISVRYLL